MFALVYAYSARSNIPSVHNLGYYSHSSLNFSMDLCATSAATKWTDISNCDMTYSKLGYSSGNIGFGDNRNDIACLNFSTIPEASSSFNGLSAIPDTNYQNFDIIINNEKTWYYGQSGYLDAGGIFTHEFGHVFGLLDVYGAVMPPLPTMYGYNEFLGSDISYDLRTLEVDDILGARYIDGPN